MAVLSWWSDLSGLTKLARDRWDGERTLSMLPSQESCFYFADRMGIMHMVCTPRLWQHKLVRGRLSMKESFFNGIQGGKDKQKKKAERKKERRFWRELISM